MFKRAAFYGSLSLITGLLLFVSALVLSRDLRAGLRRTSHQRATAQPDAQPASTAPTAAATSARHTHPDFADYTTIITERDDLARVGRTLITTVRSCRRQHGVRDPQGFDLCVSIPIRENIMRARIENVMISGAMRNLADGACAQMTGGLGNALSTLGDTSSDWTSAVELQERAQAQADVRDIVAVSRMLMSYARVRQWRTACRPRPYDPAEHGAGQPMVL